MPTFLGFLCNRLSLCVCVSFAFMFEGGMWNVFFFLAYRIMISACFIWTDNSYLTHVISPKIG